MYSYYFLLFIVTIYKYSRSLILLKINYIYFFNGNFLNFNGYFISPPCLTSVA